MNVFIANFGRENYEWPQCLHRGTVATMNAEGVHGFWERRDRAGYIEYCMRNLKAASGIAPTRSVASRWFNLMTIISETSGDVWIHREKEQIWWTVSKSDASQITLETDPRPLQGARRVYVCHKPCEPWRNVTKRGNRLEWNALHAKAKEFLFTEGTLQKLSPDHAAYALALIEGHDVGHWHDDPTWKAKAKAATTRSGVVFNGRQKSVAEMAMNARDTAARSNGQQELRTIRNKEGRSTSSFIRSSRLVPPAIDFAVGSAAIWRMASATSFARAYSRSHLRGRPNGPTSVERHLFKASHPKCPRCSSGQINATSLHEGAAVIDPDSDASTALLGCNCDMVAKGLRAMSGSHRPGIHSFAGCGSTTAIAIMRGYAFLGKYRRRCKGKSQSNKCGTDHSLTFHDLPSCLLFTTIRVPRDYSQHIENSEGAARRFSGST